MEIIPQIIPEIVGGIFLLTSIVLGYFLNRSREQRVEERKDFQRTLAKVTPESIPDLIIRRLVWKVDIKEDGSCEAVRQERIEYNGSNEVPTARRRLWHAGISPYLEKKGLRLDQLDPDKEFGIRVFDVNAGINLKSWTFIEGDQNDLFQTTIQFITPLSPDNRNVEYQIAYKNLHVSFFWKKLWEEHQDEWFESTSTLIDSYTATLLFPEKLPAWFREGEIGVGLRPQNWAEVIQGLEGSRRTLQLNASDLIAGQKYEVTFAAGAMPETL